MKTMTKLAKLTILMLSILLFTSCGGSSGTSNSEPINTAAIQQAKDTIQEIRTQAIVMVDYNNSGNLGFLDQEAINIGNALESCSSDVESTSYYLSTILNAALKSIDRVNNPDYPNFTQGNENYTLDINCTENSEQCAYLLVKDMITYNGMIILPNMKEIIENNFSTLTGQFKGDLPTHTANQTEQNVDLNLSLTRTLDGADLNISNVSLTEGDTHTAISNLFLSIGYTLTGKKIEFDYFKPRTVSIDGKCGDYTTIGNLSFSEYIINLFLSIEGSNRGWVPSSFQFDGNLTNDDSLTSILGSTKIKLLNAATVTNEKDLEVDVMVNANLSIENRPNTYLDLIYTNKNRQNDFIATYSYDDIEIEISAEIDKEQNSGKVVIDDNNGIEVHIIMQNDKIVEGNKETGEGSIITYYGSLIGTIEYIQNIVVVRYLDGTFESFP